MSAGGMTALVPPWSSNWAWSLPIIVSTVLMHSFGLLWVSEGLEWYVGRPPGRRLRHRHFVVAIGTTVLALVVLHGLEGLLWALAYVLLGALADLSSATLYSLDAMTTYGHESSMLAPPWQLMGALEALDGMILFGLTTAFLFMVMQHARRIVGNHEVMTGRPADDGWKRPGADRLGVE